MRAEVTGPKIAKLTPGVGIAIALFNQTPVDPVTGRIDRNVIAARHRPARDVVFLVLFYRKRVGGRLQLQKLIGRCGVDQGQGLRWPEKLNMVRLNEPPPGRGNRLPFAGLNRIFGMKALRSEVKYLRIITVERQQARLRTALHFDKTEIVVHIDVTMCHPLKFLKRHRVRPQQRDLGAAGAPRTLRMILELAIPLRMMRRDIVPIHQNGAITCRQIQRYQAGRVRLLIDKGDGRTLA